MADSQLSAESKEERKRLSEIIKTVHKDLRIKFKKGTKAIDEIWKEHCQNSNLLKEYAVAMHQLATSHWGNRQQERIQWCYCTLHDYFKGGGLEKCLKKDLRRKQRQMSTNINDCCTGDLHRESSSSELFSPPGHKLRVLDVGSCYNPFAELSDFDVIGIDLQPANEDVLQCDFLQLEIYDSGDIRDSVKDLSSLSSPLLCLPSASFHVVIFCLLLEYLPSCHQRWKCCTQAHKLLLTNGVLVIISPDSHKQHRNADMIRSWKAALETLSFVRWRYEKLEHVHCMIFRKTNEKCSYNSTNDVAEMMYIHQDILEEDIHLEESQFSEEDPKTFVSILQELPNFDT